MSRSVGNVLLLRDLKERGIDPLAFRYLLLTAHYRSNSTSPTKSIAGAQNALNNFRADIAELAAVAKSKTTQIEDASEPLSAVAQEV